VLCAAARASFSHAEFSLDALDDDGLGEDEEATRGGGHGQRRTPTSWTTSPIETSEHETRAHVLESDEREPNCPLSTVRTYGWRSYGPWPGL
jgi:hypothetical protein